VRRKLVEEVKQVFAEFREADPGSLGRVFRSLADGGDGTFAGGNVVLGVEAWPRDRTARRVRIPTRSSSAMPSGERGRSGGRQP
jgi:hypothetical protein